MNLLSLVGAKKAQDSSKVPSNASAASGVSNPGKSRADRVENTVENSAKVVLVKEQVDLLVKTVLF
jgi:hypothetical protein